MAAALPDNNVLKYIPQRLPIVMISTLVSATGKVTQTEFEIRETGLFVKEGVLHEPGLIENVAQTAAAGVGYQCARTGEPVPVGFIGAIKNLEIDYLPKAGEVLETRVEVLEEIFDMTLIKGESFVKGKRVLGCEMKIVLKK